MAICKQWETEEVVKGCKETHPGLDDAYVGGAQFELMESLSAYGQVVNFGHEGQFKDLADKQAAQGKDYELFDFRNEDKRIQVLVVGITGSRQMAAALKKTIVGHD